MERVANVFEYNPSYVRIPHGLKKELSTDPLYTGQKENKECDPRYDDFSLFYDVFFDLDRKNIWTVGPPLLSLEKEFADVKILYNSTPLPYTYAEFFPPHNYKRYVNRDFDPRATCAACFRIPIRDRGIEEHAPILTFVGKNWQCTVPVRSFSAVRDSQLILSVLQKNYSPQHIKEWILWHYTLYDIQTILFYDNGSDNITEVLKMCRALEAPGLSIVFVHWPYYYGGQSSRFDDLFAQYTQMNHSLWLHWQRRQYISILDMDECFVVPRGKRSLSRSVKWRPFSIFLRYDVVDTQDEAPDSIRDCTVRRKNALPEGKYFFCAKNMRYISSVHVILFPNQLFVFRSQHWERRILALLWYCVGRKLYTVLMHTLRELITFPYIIHLTPIKVIWKGNYLENEAPVGTSGRLGTLWDTPEKIKQRPFQEMFNSDVHVVDRNIQRCVRKVYSSLPESCPQ